MSPRFGTQSFRKEFTVFPANSHSEAFLVFIAVVYTLYSIGWADFHQPNWIQSKPKHISPSRSRNSQDQVIKMKFHPEEKNSPD